MSAPTSHQTKSRRAIIAAAVAVVVGLVALWYFVAGPGRSLHQLDPGHPWRIELGRGSGWHGLDTVAVGSDGAVTLHRGRGGVWETAELRLSPVALAEVLEVVEGSRVLGLRREYHAHIHDGTQWVLWVRQEGYEKAVVFDNNFPTAIERFAEGLDRILAANGLESADWRRVPDVEARRHELGLWDSITR